MDPLTEKARTPLAIRAGFALVAVLVVLALGAPPLGHTRGAWPQFLGRFHPVIIHLPIGLLVMVPVLEVIGLLGRRAEARAAAGLVLGFAAAGALAAAFDGWLLAWSGGYQGPVVTRHLWGGVALAAVCLVAARARCSASGGRLLAVPAYVACLLAALAVLVWTGHEGSKLTHGDGFLTETMPPGLRAWLRLPPPVPKPKPAARASKPTLYAAEIAPAFERSCVSCHGPTKAKGGLRLDTYRALMKGGEDGSVIEPWYPKDSELLRRVTLPRDDDDYMPSNGRNPLSAADIRAIARWVAAGASPSEPADASPEQPGFAPGGEAGAPKPTASR